ncbi:MAG: prohibitin family protein [Pseudanabaena sp. M57BS1SP1A06MG]|jgi:regulator of protease activity HflC (stomatin/prohibitin superfamily)|nr:prohibitin family protein [Pseudanabaena sp. M53BS1SP1A06MG]MCA6581238.1 prohibitin family protein [Pseudanabaena sp. M34BS1SP1A06MG]MCA6592781.1 prohibitin family protein [Pseudanabaena sp. M38BS1SP1A06MG]MCA6596990.1 prohibitin family protein [Pseudanabaena sp. M046S1SP1A06QC]MCA6601525.1 prohibitin family protein [Pseudanabaena sp. M57BS1SP1A06MG]
MSFIVSTIASLLSVLVFFNSQRLVDNRTARLVIKAIAGLIALTTAISALSRLLVVIPAGSVGVEDFQGKVSDRTLPAGLHVINPFADVVQFSTRLRDIKEEIGATSKEGLAIGIDVSIQYHIDPAKAASVYQNIGLEEREIIVSRFRSISREIVSGYPAEAIYATKREEVSLKLAEKMRSQLAPLGFVVDEALLRNVKVPETLQAAIQQRLKAEQENLQMKFVLEKEAQEAERKRIEAKGHADAQKILAEGLTPAVLQLRAIEATENLAKSTNSKVIVLGNGQGTPLILPVERDASKSVPTN